MNIDEFKKLDLAEGELVEVQETFTTGERWPLYFLEESTVCTVLLGTSRRSGEVRGVKPYALSIIDVVRPSASTKTKKSSG